MQPTASHIQPDGSISASEEPHVVLVGPPNVGKSALFNALTRSYAVVSNYPGTTVEVTRGRLDIEDETYRVTDTPGTYGLLPVGDDERVTRGMLLHGGPGVVVHVIDAKSLERMLPFSLQLRRIGIPLIVAVNMMDEAEKLGLNIDIAAMEKWLEVPVVATTATKGHGIDELKRAIRGARSRADAPGRAAPSSAEPLMAEHVSGCPFPARTSRACNARPGESAGARGASEKRRPAEPAEHRTGPPIWSMGEQVEEPVEDRMLEATLDELTRMLGPAMNNRAPLVAMLLLLGDEEIKERLPDGSKDVIARVEALREELAAPGEDPEVAIMRRYHDLSRAWVRRHVGDSATEASTLAERVHRLVVNPLTGVPVLLLILYLGLYGFVGVFGAGTVVDFLEDRIFGAFVNPWVEARLGSWLPGDAGWRYWARELVGGDYGLVPLGLTYAMAIVLPIVALFFLFFSVLEDSGYFPRLALLVDRLFKRIGLNGRAVIPIVLGFACDTMATLVTRVQESRRERIITTFLLALAVPCSAQYGVIVAVLVGRGAGLTGVSLAFLAWALIVFVVFLIAGLLASRLVPGERAGFYMELPPMRMPRPGHVLVKTFARMKWYFMEILPIFLFASFLIWIGRLTGIFEILTGALVPAVGLLGLPEATSEIFLYGFFRRDFGAAGLFDLTGTGMLDTGQVLVAAVTLTLFMPCVAQVLIMYRERGLRVTAIVVALVIMTAFLVGLMVRGALVLMGGMP